MVKVYGVFAGYTRVKYFHVRRAATKSSGFAEHIFEMT